MIVKLKRVLRDAIKPVVSMALRPLEVRVQRTLDLVNDINNAIVQTNISSTLEDNKQTMIVKVTLSAQDLLWAVEHSKTELVNKLAVSLYNAIKEKVQQADDEE
jgi:uncharacterized membrane protein YfbV (UPF0208 family)